MPLDLEIKDHIAVLTINNPPLNLWNFEMSEDLTNILDSFMGNHDVRVAVITGVGDRAFTAGHDLKDTPRTRSFRQARIYVQALQDCPVPIVGAINGYGWATGWQSPARAIFSSPRRRPNSVFPRFVSVDPTDTE